MGRVRGGSGSGTEADTRFARALREASGVAALSPSSHNCQPWGVGHVTGRAGRDAVAAALGPEPGEAGDRWLALALDRSRELTALPAHALEMEVSCGAYWYVLLRALRAQGWDCVRGGAVTGRHRTALPAAAGDAWPRAWLPLAVAALRPSGREPAAASGAAGRASALAELRAVARARRTNRGAYRPEGITPQGWEALDRTRPWAAERPFAGAADVRVRHLRTPAERERLAALVARYAGRDFSHRRAWRETHGYLRWSAADARAGGDGLPVTQLFGPLSAPGLLRKRLALAPSAMRLLRWTGYPGRLAAGLATLVRDAPAAVVMSLAGGSGGPEGPEGPGTEAALHGGARLADYWFRATRAGLALHPVSVVLQHDDARRELAEAFGIEGRAFFLSRIGYPACAFPPTPRRVAAHRSV
ncbi:RedV protein [Streptomyces sp. MAR4 CNX-425]|uniref:RedV protein n=1 Tax=Streptomyces sp. MAR4 CNX-425 TaxID=3406343 RepID=UPI003B5136D2